jgi:Protein of unknown function (DUF2523)
MPFFVAALLGALIQAVGKVLISLGMGYFVFTGIDVSITFARDFLLTKVSGLPTQAIAAAGAMKVGVCISILTSALVARMTLQGLTGGTLRRMVIKS